MLHGTRGRCSKRSGLSSHLRSPCTPALSHRGRGSVCPRRIRSLPPSPLPLDPLGRGRAEAREGPRLAGMATTEARAALDRAISAGLAHGSRLTGLRDLLPLAERARGGVRRAPGARMPHANRASRSEATEARGSRLPAMASPISETVQSRRASDSTPWNITAMRSATAKGSSSRSSEISRIAAPRARAASSCGMNVGHRADVQAPGRLVGDDNARLGHQRPAQDELLDIAARQRAGRRIQAAAAHVELLDDRPRVGTGRAAMQPAERARSSGRDSVRRWRSPTPRARRSHRPQPRSSGTRATPARMKARGIAFNGRPSTSDRTALGRRSRPYNASASCACPLPETPAMPKISARPARETRALELASRGEAAYREAGA